MDHRGRIVSGMLRIDPVPETGGGLLLRYARHASRKKVGKVVEPLTVTAHSTPALLGMGAMETALERFKAIDHRLAELAVLKTAALVGCHFCIDIGSKLGQDAGLTEEQVLDLHEHATSPQFDDVERLVCDYAEAMTATPGAVTDDLVARLRAHFGEPALVELTAAIAWENFRARFNDAFGMGSAGFSHASACAVAPRRGGDAGVAGHAAEAGERAVSAA